MPDLHELLDLEARAQRPVRTPPFGVLLKRRRRRQRVRAGACLVGLGLGVVILQQGFSEPQMARLATVPTPPPSIPIATCRPRDLVLALTWQAAEAGGLSGTLTAHNATDRPCLLLVKPDVQPDGLDGTPLPTQLAVSMEKRLGPNQLLPGATATAPISWFSWCGAAAGRTAHVSWASDEHVLSAQVNADGPTQPTCLRQYASSNQLSSSWFVGLRAGNTATVSGVLRFVGGAQGAEVRGVPGTVTLTDADGLPYLVQANQDGRFSLAVPAGFFYAATATSPLYNNGKGSCGSEEKVYVPSVGLTDLTVDCQLN